MKSPSKVYLGDGVYVSLENSMIKLWTSDGHEESEPIWLEPEVLAGLVKWASAIGIKVAGNDN